jgi:hypothetical protein
MSTISTVLDEVASERMRQEQLKASGKFLWTCADNVALRQKVERAITEPEKLAVLGEEFGEVSKEVVEEIIANDRLEPAKAAASRSKLRKELLEVAACCVAWVESLDARGVTATCDHKFVDSNCCIKCGVSMAALKAGIAK